jgi:hypothetical protein
MYIVIFYLPIPDCPGLAGHAVTSNGPRSILLMAIMLAIKFDISWP